MEKKKFKITVEETLAREVFVEANSLHEAINLVKKQYRDEEIVLTADDIIDVDFLAEDKDVPPNFN